MTINQLLRETRFNEWEAGPEYIWQDDAACAFSPPTMFEVAFEGDPIAEGLSVNEIKDLNSTNLAAAQKICNRCPVWSECYASADPQDFHTTMRAGIIPLRHNPTLHGRPSTINHSGPRPKLDPTKPCLNGHDVNDWVKRADKGNSWRCQGCVRDRLAQKKREAATPKEKRQKIDPSKPCPAGHFDWLIRKDGQPRCRDCIRIQLGQTKRKPISPTDRCSKGHCDWYSYETKAGRTRRSCRTCKRERDNTGAAKVRV